MKHTAEKIGNYYEENIKGNDLFWGVVPCLVICAFYLVILMQFVSSTPLDHKLAAITKGLTLYAAFSGCTGQVVSSFHSSSVNAGTGFSIVGALISSACAVIQIIALAHGIA